MAVLLAYSFLPFILSNILLLIFTHDNDKKVIFYSILSIIDLSIILWIVLQTKAGNLTCGYNDISCKTPGLVEVAAAISLIFKWLIFLIISIKNIISKKDRQV